MKRMTQLATVLTAAWLAAIATPAQAGSLLFSQLNDGQSTFGPSEVWTPSNIDSEVADDFDLVASIDRVVADGFVWGSVTFEGVYVRFYAYNTDGTPGALQKEYFFTTGYNAGTIDVTLSPAFVAAGKHFLSVQPVLNGWYWWSAHTNAPQGTAFYYRDNAAGQIEWQHNDGQNSFYPDSDVAFALYGSTSGAGQITTLTEATLPRSGYLEINGTNFGSGGTALVDGVSAPVADWQSTKIVCYVPESTQLATVPVQVLNDSGLPSNAVNLTVTARQAEGQVNWRFRMNGPYSFVRPANGPDGTIYAVDAFAHLYALTPDGALKWLVRGAGDKGVAAGSDGAIYVASENDIKAFNPDGSAKWTFVQNPRAFICLGVSVGPDGNIYSVGTEGPGVFSLTPAGTLRWQQPEAYDRLIVDYAEIVFGPNGSDQQLYFYANHHLRSLRLDGTPVFALPGTFAQPAIGPDGNVHISATTYAPNGSLLWAFTGGPFGAGPSDVGSDGITYFGALFALNPDGSLRWNLPLTDYVSGVMVDPLNTQLVTHSVDTLDHAGFVLSSSAQDGHELWRVVLPLEDPTVWNPGVGIYGFNQFVTTRARFTADGQTVYVHTATATGDNNTSKSFLYSLNTAVTTTQPVLRSTAISLTTARSGKSIKATGKVAVKDGNGIAVSGATTFVTWNVPSGGTITQTATTNTKGQAAFTVTDLRGSYTITVTNLTKTGYTFDPANSVLTKTVISK